MAARWRQRTRAHRRGCRRGRAGAAGICGHDPKDSVVGRREADDIRSMVFAPGWAQGGDFWQLELSAPQLRAVQRLRLGLHSLPVETGRFAKIDRQDRCPCAK